MIKRLLPVLIIATFCGVVLSGCSLKKPFAVLQVESNPVANVFIDGQSVGKTPYTNKEIKPGEVQVKIIPDDATMSSNVWEGKVKLSSGILTLINRQFSENEAKSSGYILSLEKGKSKESPIYVVSSPDNALVKVDGETKGLTPMTVATTLPGEHTIAVSKEGYVSQIVTAKTVVGFRLIIDTKLAENSTQGGSDSATITPSPSGSFTPTPKANSKVTPTVGKNQPTPTVKPKTTPTTGGEVDRPYVLIKSTSTGWLRVRDAASSSGTEIAKVNPGEKYPLLDSQSGWLKIRLTDGTEGWISGAYATKYE